MTAATKNRNTAQRLNTRRGYPMAAGAVGYAGTIAVLSAGFATVATEATGLVAVGRFAAQYDNRNGSAGAVTAEVESGVFCYDNDSTDPVTTSHTGQLCYLVDDQTVSASDSEGTRSPAGIVDTVDDSGVWLLIDPLSGASAFTAA